MKKVSKFAMMLLCGAFALGFTSCSDDDDDNNGSSEDITVNASEMQSMVSSYVNTVVNPTYSDLQAAAEQLHTACAQLYREKQAGNVQQTTIDAACTAFKNARKFWEQSEAFLYGPATDDGIDPHMDSWPLDQTQLAQALTNADLIAGITGSNPDQYVYTNNGKFDSTLGFHGLEYILFRNGENRKADAFNAEYEDGSGLNSKGENVDANRRLLQTVPTINEAAFANAVSGDLKNMTKLLEYEWDGNASCKSYILSDASWVLGSSQYADHSTANFTSGNPYGVDYIGLKISSATTWPANISNILDGGCHNICEEVYVQKLGQAYRIAVGDNSGHTGEEGEHEADAADYIESPYSKRSFQDYQDNIYSIKNTLYGQRNTEGVTTVPSGSILAFLIKNYPEGQDLSNKLNAAINAFETAKNSGKAFIDAPGDPQVKTCMDAVEALDDALTAAAQWCNAHIRVAQ